MHDLYFLISDDNKILDHVYERDSLMKEIINEAKQIAGVEKMNLYLTDEEILKLDQEDYYQKGVDETKKEIIINMFNDKVSIGTIAKYSNLSIDEVQKIIDSSK